MIRNLIKWVKLKRIEEKFKRIESEIYNVEYPILFPKNKCECRCWVIDKVVITNEEG